MSSADLLGAVLTPRWYGCYSVPREGLFTHESNRHPAKMAVGLAFRIFDHGARQGYWKKGDTVLDPMAGIGTTLLVGGALGYCVVGVELEPHFVEMAQENLARAQRLRIHSTGRCAIRQGDARDLRGDAARVPGNARCAQAGRGCLPRHQEPGPRREDPPARRRHHRADGSCRLPLDRTHDGDACARPRQPTLARRLRKSQFASSGRASLSACSRRSTRTCGSTTKTFCSSVACRRIPACAHRFPLTSPSLCAYSAVCAHGLGSVAGVWNDPRSWRPSRAAHQGEGDMSLDLLTLRRANVRRCEKAFGHPVSEWSETDWGCAAAGEMGELCNLLKKRRRGENIPLEAVMDEIADVIIYLDLLAAHLHVHLSGPIRKKFNEVSERRGCSIRL